MTDSRYSFFRRRTAKLLPWFII